MAISRKNPTDPVTRRDFLKTGTAVTVLGAGSTPGALFEALGEDRAVSFPVVVSTWPFGLRANSAAMETLKRGGSALDAVEQGVQVVEADPEVTSVGYGGLPHAAGEVELDASVLDGNGLRCGGVAALRNILHPVSVARKVMEETPHVRLVGDGALRFARSQGFAESDLLTVKARKAWNAWKKREGKKADPNSRENHDTIGMIALDEKTGLAAAVTTSGLAFKLPGRVGDSPLIGAGICADRRVGAAVSTGVGEEAIRVLGSFLVVEYLRKGAAPEDAVREVLRRVKAVNENRRESFQLAFLALTREGKAAGAALQEGFIYAVSDGGGRHELVECGVV